MTKTILLLAKFVLSKMSHESEHSESEFYYPGELSHAELLHQSPTHSESNERNLTLLANEEAQNFLRGQQANRRSRKQLFRINCPITNLWNRQTVSRRNFFPWKASTNSSRIKSKKNEEVNKVRYKCFLRISVFLGEVTYTKKISTSVLFEETKLNANTSSLPYSSFRWYKNSLVFNCVISTTPAKPAMSANPGTVCRAKHLCH